ncbi:hypothetical protein Patl1_23756 [Pistacia atlantica]|uniref:Uncharacterized protein n=1 Tax=Pistacia atlantica TaxID=434234 RepID=A0ACC1A1B9_9ROSI|nr:hypothetical protein Patl1_23756 [Pistacia atlantica]
MRNTRSSSRAPANQEWENNKKPSAFALEKNQSTRHENRVGNPQMMDALGTLALIVHTLLQHLDATTNVLKVEGEHNQCRAPQRQVLRGQLSWPPHTASAMFQLILRVVVENHQRQVCDHVICLDSTPIVPFHLGIDSTSQQTP